MCFRPAEADAASGIGPTPCPHCGKTVFPAEGLLPKKCPFCREELKPVVNAPKMRAVDGSVAAPGAPEAPRAPRAPVAPKAAERATGD